VSNNHPDIPSEPQPPEMSSPARSRMAVASLVLAIVVPLFYILAAILANTLPAVQELPRNAWRLFMHVLLIISLAAVVLGVAGRIRIRKSRRRHRYAGVGLNLAVCETIFLLAAAWIMWYSAPTVRLVRVTDGREALVLKLEASSVAFSPAGDTMVVLEIGSQQTAGMVFYRVPDGKMLGRLKHPVDRHSPFCTDGRYLAVGGRDLTLWEVPSGELIGVLRDAPPYTSAIYYNIDATLLAAGDGTISAWQQPEKFTVPAEWQGRLYSAWSGRSSGPSIHASASNDGFSQNGTYLAWIDGGIRVWELEGRRIILSTTKPAHAWAFSHDDKLIAISDDEGLVIMRLRDGKLVRRLGRDYIHEDCIGFSPDGRVLASTDRYATRIVDLSTGKLVRSMRGASFVTFSPDGKYLALVSAELGNQ
jgi:WD40 repeat protein